MNLVARDQKSIWHPLTQHQTAAPPVPIARGEGAYLIDYDENRYLDLISSWWVNLHGHANPEIAQAIYQQALKLEQVIFAGFTHEPAVSLAEKLLSLLPSVYTKVFYSDNGSTAIEIALKMAYQYWRNKGEEQRRRFVSFQNSYHGDTFGAMSVGRENVFSSQFDDLLFAVDKISFPATWMQDEITVEKEQMVLNEMETFLKKHAHETAAVIIEPLLQGACGMNMCTPRFLKNLEMLVRQHDVLMIYDEVLTGFGRTGELFACIKAQTTPDIVCLAKGLTGGFLPLAVTTCHEKIYEAFLGDNFNYTLAHGHTFSANPLGCVAALKSLEILTRPETLQQIAMIERVHKEELMQLQVETNIERARVCGTVAAFDLATHTSYGSNFSLALRSQFLKRGLLLRPLGNVIYFLPPYCVTEAELRHAYKIVMQEIQGVTA